MEPTQAQPPWYRQTITALFAWLPQLRQEIWILAVGQLLLYIGQGFTLVYASIYFVNELGFSPTQVGVALGSSGIAGIAGRVWVGQALDSDRWGRRRTLLLAAVIPALACFCLALADTFVLLVLGNLLLGLGISLYWPANLAMTTDLTTVDNRTEAFALTRLVDNLGLGIGALLAGQYIAMAGSYSVLFILKGVTYLLFGVVIYRAIAETRQPSPVPRSGTQGWRQALSHRDLLTYLAANMVFTIYAAQHSSTLPLYLANFIPHGNTATGFSEQWISYFFVWNALLKIGLQLPITRGVRRMNHVVILLIALAFWSGGFLLVWVTGIVPAAAWIAAIAAFTLISLAEILYSPAGVAVVSSLSPDHLRGIYFSLESQCWAIGFMVGPAVGGWALDHPAIVGARLWLWLVAGGGLASGILLLLKQQLADTAAVNDALAIETPNDVAIR